MGERLFQCCAYCGLLRLCEFYGRRWLCDGCAAEAFGPIPPSSPMSEGDE